MDSTNPLETVLDSHIDIRLRVKVGISALRHLRGTQRREAQESLEMLLPLCNARQRARVLSALMRYGGPIADATERPEFCILDPKAGQLIAKHYSDGIHELWRERNKNTPALLLSRMVSWIAAKDDRFSMIFGPDRGTQKLRAEAQKLVDQLDREQFVLPPGQLYFDWEARYYEKLGREHPEFYR